MKKYAPVISLADSLVDELFPFLLVLDEELRIIKFGRKVAKVHPEIALEMPLLDAFTIHRPRLHKPTFATLQRAGSVFFLDSKSTKIRLRGQIVLEEQRGLLLFIGTPWFTDIAELEKSGFELRDFTLHDPIMDYLYMVQAKTLALEDTQRLTEALTQLEKKSRELEQANAAKSQFLANTSHELRTPLNGIIGMASLLARTPLDGQQRHYLNTTLKSAKSLLSVVNDILDISKAEAGKLSLDITELNLHELLDSITDVFSVAAHQKGLELLCVTDRDVPGILRGDPVRLRQIIDNFLSNALKFTRKGEIALHVKLVEQKDDVVVLRFSIKDTGIGIAEPDQQKLFRVFSQIDSSMSRSYQGTGLGLSICKQLAQLMGGDVGVSSIVGEGSTFYFTATLRRSAQVKEDIHHDQALEAIRTLVVDDNASNRAYLQSLLERWGAKPAAADGALAALETLRAAHAAGQSFHLALLDLRMPGMTGIDLAHVLAADPAFSNLRVVLMSSGDVHDSASFAKARISAVLPKPVRPSLLLNCLSGLMTQFARRPPAQPTVVLDDDYDDEDDDDLQEPLTPIPTLPPSTSNKVQLLVVDDNPVNIEVAARMLESLGYRVDSAKDGQQALNLIERTSYAAVLMDLQMPVLDGYRATEELRRREGNGRRTPVIAMTAHAMPGDRQRALSGNMDDYVSKPIDFDALEKIVTKWAPRPPSRSAHAATATEKSGALQIPKPVPVSPGSEGAPPILDTSVLDQLRQYKKPGVADYVLHVVAMFLKDLEPRLVKLRAAPSDHELVERIVHALKSTSGMVGAQRLYRSCQKVEQAARDKEDDLAILVGKLLTEADLARAALEAMQTQPSR